MPATAPGDRPCDRTVSVEVVSNVADGEVDATLVDADVDGDDGGAEEVGVEAVEDRGVGVVRVVGVNVTNPGSVGTVPIEGFSVASGVDRTQPI